MSGDKNGSLGRRLQTGLVLGLLLAPCSCGADKVAGSPQANAAPKAGPSPKPPGGSSSPSPTASGAAAPCAAISDGPPRPLWEVPWDGPFGVGPQGQVVATLGNDVGVVDPSTGAFQWHVPASFGASQWAQAPVSQDGMVVTFRREDRSLSAHRLSDGSLLWRAALEPSWASAPSVQVCGAYVLLFADTRALQAHDAATGVRRWAVDVDKHSTGFACDADQVYTVPWRTAKDTASVEAYALATGQKRWSIPALGLWTYAAIVDKKPLFIDESAIIARHPDDGRALWTYQREQVLPLYPTFTTVHAVHGPDLLVQDAHGVVALNATTGQPRWPLQGRRLLRESRGLRVDLPGQPPLLLEGEGQVLRMSTLAPPPSPKPCAASGVLWEKPLNLPTDLPIAAGAVIGATETEVVALELTNGATRWRLPQGGMTRLSTLNDRALVLSTAGWPSGLVSLSAREGRDGSAAWTASLDCASGLEVTHCGKDAVVLCADSGGGRAVLAVEGDKGTVRWRTKAPADAMTLACNAEAVFVAPWARDDKPHTVAAYALTNGTLRWKAPMRGLHAALATTADRLVLATESHVAGLEASTGREVWSSNESNLDAAMLGRLRLVASDNDVFLKGSNGVAVFDAATGQKRQLERVDELFAEAQARRVQGVDARGELLLAPVEDGVRVSLAQPAPARVEIPPPPPGPPAASGSSLRPRPTSTGAGDGKPPPPPRH